MPISGNTRRLYLSHVRTASVYPIFRGISPCERYPMALFSPFVNARSRSPSDDGPLPAMRDIADGLLPQPVRIYTRLLRMR